MATDRTVSATWNGSLLEGAGTIHAAGSGAFGPLAVSWASRAEEPNGKTSPEELIAAAHAIADKVLPDQLNSSYIVPSVFDTSVAPAVAAAVREVATAQA